MRAAPLLTFCRGLRFLPANDFLPELLVVALEELELAQSLVEVHAGVSDDVAVVVRVAGAVLDDHPQDAADELDVRCERPEGPEDRRDAQLGVVESLAEHLYLDNAVELAAREASFHLSLLVLVHLAVDQVCLEPARLVELDDLAGVVHAARDGDELVRGTGLAELFEPLQAVINNGLVAGLGERDAAAEPVLLLHREDLVQRIDLRLALRRELQFSRCGVRCGDALDVPLEGRLLERVPVDEVPFDLLRVTTEGRRSHVDHAGVLEVLVDFTPALGRRVVRFVHDDHVEEIARELVQPLLGVGGELLDVRNDEVRLLADRQIPGVKGRRERPADHRLVGKDVTFPPEALLSVRDVQGLEDSFLDRKVRCDDQYPSFRDPEGRDRRDTRLPTADGDLDDRRVLACLEVLVQGLVGFDLWLA